LLGGCSHGRCSSVYGGLNFAGLVGGRDGIDGGTIFVLLNFAFDSVHGDLNGERSAFEVLVVQSSKSLQLISLSVEFNKAKALRSAGLLYNDVRRLVSNVAIFEKLSKTLVLNLEGQVGNKESGR